MNRRTATIVASILGAVGLLLILAGPAFHLIPNEPSIFAAIACWIVSGLIRGLVKRDGQNSRGRESSGRKDSLGAKK